MKHLTLGLMEALVIIPGLSISCIGENKCCWLSSVVKYMLISTQSDKRVYRYEVKKRHWMGTLSFKRLVIISAGITVRDQISAHSVEVYLWTQCLWYKGWQMCSCPRVKKLPALPKKQWGLMHHKRWCPKSIRFCKLASSISVKVNTMFLCRQLLNCLHLTGWS